MKDLFKAFDWYMKAAEQGHKEATEIINRLKNTI